MDYFTVCLAALTCAGLTFFSGFGLGTMLMPVFAVFFPVDVAVALTAIIHLCNNLFKSALLFKHIQTRIFLKFGIPAMVTAWIGARLLVRFSEFTDPVHYTLFSRSFEVLPVKLMIAALILLFILLEIAPFFKRMEFTEKHLTLGGILSGFFGGLSGHQGALRSAFLLKMGLPKEAYIGTGVAIGCLVDITRLMVYGVHFRQGMDGSQMLMLGGVVLSALFGSWLARRFLKKVRMQTIHVFVIVLLSGIAVGLALGLI